MGDNKLELTEQEADLYDRQIRLWGLESQKKLRAADVLLINVRALGAEIAKNILLSGIKSLTFLDDGTVTQEDLMTNFLLPRDSLGKNVAEAVLDRARNLNSMVQISADSQSVNDKDQMFYKKFTLIVATRLPTEQLISINQICRQNGTQFLCGDVFGLFGYTFSDLQIHEYYVDSVQFVANKKRKLDKDKKVDQTTVRVVKNITYVPLQDALGVDWTPEEQKKVTKLTPWYLLARVLLRFRDVHKRNVLAEERDADITKLKEIRDKLLKSLDINTERLPDETFDLVFGEVVPVCAIVGGVLAQEIIKAVSHNEAPLNNMFFFDPNNFSGKIECVGN